MKVALVDSNVMGNKIVKDALSVCRNKKCDGATITHCLKAQPVPHLAAIEFLDFTFRVEKLSVKARIQLERHRLFTSMERSTRAIEMSEAEIIVPPTAKNPELFKQAYERARKDYIAALDMKETKEDAAYILPLGIETSFFLKGNGRVFFEYFTKRLCRKHVQREHFLFALELYRVLVGEFPQFKYAVPCRECRGCNQPINKIV